MFGRLNEARHGGADDGKYNIKKHELISIVTLTERNFTNKNVTKKQSD